MQGIFPQSQHRFDLSQIPNYTIPKQLRTNIFKLGKSSQGRHFYINEKQNMDKANEPNHV